jgi:hypothetical protein
LQCTDTFTSAIIIFQNTPGTVPLSISMTCGAQTSSPPSSTYACLLHPPARPNLHKAESSAPAQAPVTSVAADPPRTPEREQVQLLWCPRQAWTLPRRPLSEPGRWAYVPARCVARRLVGSTVAACLDSLLSPVRVEKGYE